jgi:protein-S-isoprenylcysteine O-methyltransferase Ste14
MSPSSQSTASASSSTPRGAAWLNQIPLSIRMAAYSLSFLAFVLGLLPWLAHRLDVYYPQWHVEIGPVRLLGLVIAAVCLGLYAAASYTLTTHGRGAYVEFDPPREFVAVGPFRWCRNPIAGSLALSLLGLALTFSSTGIFLYFLLGLVLAHVQVVWLEEPLLRRRFGAAYERYLRETPRWRPRRPPRSAT